AFVEGGYLFLATAEGEEVLRSNLQTQQAEGADIQMFAAAELAAKYPWMNTSDLAAGSLGLSGEGWLDAYGMMQGMRRKAISLGATYRAARVQKLLHQNGSINGVELENGEKIHAKFVINAAGTDATRLAQTAGIELPV